MAAAPVAGSPARFTVIGGYVAAMVRALEARGIPVEAALGASGIERVPANDPLARVPVRSLHELFDAAVALTGDPYFGLYAANFLHPTNMHAIGLALLASTNLREFGERLSKYFRAFSNAWEPRLREYGDTARLEYPRLTETPHLAEDSFGLFMIQLIRELSDGRIAPVAIEMHRPTPPDGGPRHRRAFGCPLSFGNAYHAVVFDARALDMPLAGASRELAEYNDQIVIGYLAKLDRSDIQMRVKALLRQELAAGGVTKESIAKQLCMSPRTLQIKLAKSDTTFHDLVNETRRALACAYIERSAMSITEIAYELGFSDTSNFSRAFRRWTGRSPRGYSAQLRDPDGAAAPDDPPRRARVA